MPERCAAAGWLAPKFAREFASEVWYEDPSDTSENAGELVVSLTSSNSSDKPAASKHTVGIKGLLHPPFRLNVKINVLPCVQRGLPSRWAKQDRSLKLQLSAQR